MLSRHDCQIVQACIFTCLVLVVLLQAITTLHRTNDTRDILLQTPPAATGSFVFVHIPKTAGTSVTEYIKAGLRERGCIEARLQNASWQHAQSMILNAIVENASHKFSLQEAQLTVRSNTSCTYVHAEAGPDYDGRGKLVQRVIGEGIRVTHILGHVPYGFCSFAVHGCKYITLLRDPVERLHSQ